MRGMERPGEVGKGRTRQGEGSTNGETLESMGPGESFTNSSVSTVAATRAVLQTVGQIMEQNKVLVFAPSGRCTRRIDWLALGRRRGNREQLARPSADRASVEITERNIDHPDAPIAA